MTQMEPEFLGGAGICSTFWRWTFAGLSGLVAVLAAHCDGQCCAALVAPCHSSSHAAALQPEEGNAHNHWGLLVTLGDSTFIIPRFRISLFLSTTVLSCIHNQLYCAYMKYLFKIMWQVQILLSDEIFPHRIMSQYIKCWLFIYFLFPQPSSQNQVKSSCWRFRFADTCSRIFEANPDWT